MRATTSFPTPLSPLMNTGTSTGAICKICWRILSICGLDARKERSSVSCLAVFPERLVLGTQLLLLAALQKRGIKLRLLEGLGQVVERAQANRFDNRRHFVRAGKHDDVQRAVQLHQLPQSLEAVDFRHQHIENHEVRTFARSDFLQRIFAARHRFDRETVHFEQRLQIFPDARFVVYDQNFFFVGHYLS